MEEWGRGVEYDSLWISYWYDMLSCCTNTSRIVMNGLSKVFCISLCTISNVLLQWTARFSSHGVSLSNNGFKYLSKGGRCKGEERRKNEENS